MASFRDIKRNARRVLHDRMKVAALYVDPEGTATAIGIRDHTKFRVNAIEGGVRSGSGQMAGRQEAAPFIVFMLPELEAAGITPVRRGIVSVERGEAYRLNNAEAPDDITVKWVVTQITDSTELAALPVPDDE